MKQYNKYLTGCLVLLRLEKGRNHFLLPHTHKPEDETIDGVPHTHTHAGQLGRARYKVGQDRGGNVFLKQIPYQMMYRT